MQEHSLDDRIEQLSAIGAFPPPPGFAEHAHARDRADHVRAAADGPAWWADVAPVAHTRWSPCASAVARESPRSSSGSERQERP